MSRNTIMRKLRDGSWSTSPYRPAKATQGLQRLATSHPGSKRQLALPRRRRQPKSYGRGK